jgi:hypothetical protein
MNTQNILVADCLLGPHVLPHRLMGNHHRDFLSHGVPLAVRTQMWCTHDGAPAHFSRPVRDVLNNTCHGRCIGSGGHTARPPSSPDLNPLDFYL